MFTIYVDYGKCRHPCLSSSSHSGFASPIQYITMPNKLVFISINLLLPNRMYIESRYTAKTLRFFLLNCSIHQQLHRHVRLFDFYRGKAPSVNLFFIPRLNARKSMNEQEISSIDVSRALNTRSGLSLPDLRNISVDNKTIPVRFMVLSQSRERWTHD